MNETTTGKAPGPTWMELEAIADQVTQQEWQRLCLSAEFIDAACVSLDETARVARLLLGRDIVARPPRDF